MALSNDQETALAAAKAVLALARRSTANLDVEAAQRQIDAADDAIDAVITEG